MIVFKYVLLLYLVVGCAGSRPKRLASLAREIGRGDVDVIKIESTDDVKCSDAVVSNDLSNEIAIVLAPMNFKLDFLKCILISNKNEIREIHYKIKVDQFKSEKLRVDPSKVVLSKTNIERALKEKRMITKIYERSSKNSLFKNGFQLPIETKITSLFGTQREYNGVKKSYHTGLDFRAIIGRKIFSTNDGVVVLYDDLFFTGKTVVVDHGLGIFSIYGHLDRSDLKEGDILNRGDIIGYAGNTGRSTGPHLHWGIKFKGQNVSGLSLIEKTKTLSR